MLVFVAYCRMEVKVKRFFIILAIAFVFLITPLAAYADVVVGPEAFFQDYPVIIIIILVAIVVVVTILLVKLYRRKHGK